jgi:hypothetical protein
MCPPEKEPLRELVKDLDRLLDWQLPEEIHEKIWTLIGDVQDYRRKKDRGEAKLE